MVSHQEELPGGWPDQRQGPRLASVPQEIEQHQVIGDPEGPGPRGPLDGNSIRAGPVQDAGQAPSTPSMGLLVYHPDCQRLMN